MTLHFKHKEIAMLWTLIVLPFFIACGEKEEDTAQPEEVQDSGAEEVVEEPSDSGEEEPEDTASEEE